MGLEIRIYGVIYLPLVRASDRDQSKDRLTQKLSCERIASLPDSDDVPPLVRGTFSAAVGNSTNGRYCTQMLHFGLSWKAASYPGLPEDVEDWLKKFEDLLGEVYWREAVVHVDSEWGPQGSYVYTVETDDLAGYAFDPPRLPEKWQKIARKP